MTWEPIERRALQTTSVPRITIAAAEMGRHPHQQISITWRFAPEWFARGRPISVALGRGDDAGMLRIAAGGNLTAITVPSPGKATVHVGQVRLGAWGEVTHGKHKAVECAFRVDGEAVIITLPDWARGPVVGVRDDRTTGPVSASAVEVVQPDPEMPAPAAVSDGLVSGVTSATGPDEAAILASAEVKVEASNGTTRPIEMTLRETEPYRPTVADMVRRETRANQPAAPRPALKPPPAVRTVGEAMANANRPFKADAETIRHWAAQRGIGNGVKTLDLDQVNAARRKHQLPPFELVEPTVARRY